MGSEPSAKRAKLSKNQKRRLKKKQDKLDQAATDASSGSKDKQQQPATTPPKDNAANKTDPNVDIEYVSMGAEDLAPMEADFKDVLSRFLSSAEDDVDADAVPHADKPTDDDDEDDDDAMSTGEGESTDPAEAQLSKKERTRQNRLRVAELKQLVSRPDVVEQHDVTAADPRLLVYIKSYRNTVPVPKHWSHKRKYLQGKRGVEKIPFQLPDFIVDTGINKIKEAMNEKDAESKLKSRQRDRVKPRMGKVDIDYQVLHDAFFKYQTKPKMSEHGDLYYEGKEFEADVSEKTPGVLSDELRHALGMPPGAPPPWLVYMQRMGPPPSYPSLKIPGLNAPLPTGAEWGFHAGGWGTAPLDAQGNGVYGDVLGNKKNDEAAAAVALQMAATSKDHWGQLAEEDSEAEETDDEDMEEEGGHEDQDDEEMASGTASMFTSGAASTMRDGIASVATVGTGIGGALDLRKGSQSVVSSVGGAVPPMPPMPPPPPPPMAPPMPMPPPMPTAEGDGDAAGVETKKPSLFQVLGTVETGVGGSDLYGGTHKYVIPGAGAGSAEFSRRDAEAEEVAEKERMEEEKRVARAKRKREKKEREMANDFKF